MEAEDLPKEGDPFVYWVVRAKDGSIAEKVAPHNALHFDDRIDDFADCRGGTKACRPLQDHLDERAISSVDVLAIDTEGHDG